MILIPYILYYGGWGGLLYNSQYVTKEKNLVIRQTSHPRKPSISFYTRNL